MIHTIIALFLLSSCSYFEEEEILLQGKRVEVFKKKEEKLIKSRLSVKLPESINIDEWPMQNQNIANKISHFKANESIKIKWIKKISKEKFDENISVTKPIIFDNKILLISNDLEVKAINLKNNKILWQTKLEDEFDEDSSPSKRDPAIHSALSLQLWLDEHCGGWQNTFG